MTTSAAPGLFWDEGSSPHPLTQPAIAIGSGGRGNRPGEPDSGTGDASGSEGGCCSGTPSFSYQTPKVECQGHDRVIEGIPLAFRPTRNDGKRRRLAVILSRGEGSAGGTVSRFAPLVDGEGAYQLAEMLRSTLSMTWVVAPRAFVADGPGSN